MDPREGRAPGERTMSFASRQPVAAPELVAIDVKPGGLLESQSGLQMLRPRIWGALQRPSGPSGRLPHVAAVVMHPASNFMGHYLLQPLAERGLAVLGLNSRYAGNDTLLLMERVIQDLGAGVAWLRAQGAERVLLVGNSGGAALAAFYAAQSESLTATHFPDGDATQLVPADLPPVQGLALCAAHEGRSRLMANWIDPSVTDERDPLSREARLDIHDPSNGPPFSADFLARFRAAQAARRDRIEAWCLERLSTLRSTLGAARDQVFAVYRTHADPRCLDLSLDPNDRKPGSVWGDSAAVNASAYAMGRVSSLTAFLSQWSGRSQADGPANLARCSHPALLLTYTADQSTFPSTREAWLEAGGPRIRNVDIRGANHYLSGQPALVTTVADEIAAFAERL
jgi:pimeloyl-ACP methyl ester carboxylesterase